MGVLAFTPKVEQDPYLSGTARCIHCAHTWVAVAPVGTVELECPECRASKGRFLGLCMPEEHVEVRTCNCGNQLFYLTREGHMCANCGTYQRYD